MCLSRFVYAVNFVHMLAAPIFSCRWNIKIIQDCIVSVAYVNDPNSHIKPGVDIIILATNASVNSSCDHPPPPPGTVWGICNAYLSPRPGICSCVFARVNIGLLPPGICRSQRKDRGHEFTLLYTKMETIKYVKQILYNILLLNVGFQV
jgi:hypothetical protein